MITRLTFWRGYRFRNDNVNILDEIKLRPIYFVVFRVAKDINVPADKHIIFRHFLISYNVN